MEHAGIVRSLSDARTSKQTNIRVLFAINSTYRLVNQVTNARLFAGSPVFEANSSTSQEANVSISFSICSANWGIVSWAVAGIRFDGEISDVSNSSLFRLALSNSGKER